MLPASMRKELTELKEWYARKIAAIDELLDEKASPKTAGTEPIRRGGRLKALADAAYAVLDKAGGPMRRESILMQLENAGIPVHGDGTEKKLALLSSAMSKDARFKSQGKGTGVWDIDRGHSERVDRPVDQADLLAGVLGTEASEPAAPMPEPGPLPPPPPVQGTGPARRRLRVPYENPAAPQPGPLPPAPPMPRTAPARRGLRVPSKSPAVPQPGPLPPPAPSMTGTAPARRRRIPPAPEALA